ncbi:hypothetical protein B0H16DRAFT_323411 [Mycena metata]|uniref:Uncharacterized protein n=1 Tax=Mycena metata TaxID=1033252 RepID=A0AAD7HNB8_9AGAR|nr:hypothetical protein B0H16DRAFT_323411 [Mycena metata]
MMRVSMVLQEAHRWRSRAWRCTRSHLLSFRNRPPQERRNTNLPPSDSMVLLASAPAPIPRRLHYTKMRGRSDEIVGSTWSAVYEDHNGGISKDLGALGYDGKCSACFGLRRRHRYTIIADIRMHVEGESARSGTLTSKFPLRRRLRIGDGGMGSARSSYATLTSASRSRFAHPATWAYLPFLRAKRAIGRDQVPLPATSEDRGSSTRGVMRTGDGTGAGGGGTGRGKDLELCRKIGSDDVGD